MQMTSQPATPDSGPGKQMLFGVPIDALRLSEVLDLAEAAIAQRRRLLISVVNAGKIVDMNRDGNLRAAVLQGDLILADGMGVVWAARLLDRPLPERVAGIDIMFGLLERAAARAHRVYLFGAKPAVLDAAIANVGTRFPGAAIAGAHHGYYQAGEESRIAEEIAACRPDILFVANASPAKELFLARFADRLDVPVCLGVGGSFDVLGGRVKRAPAVWQRLGLEWAYRLAQEPNRLWRRYLEGNVSFARMTASEYFANQRRKRI